MKTKYCCVSPQETQTDFTTTNVVVQTNFVENIHKDYYMTQGTAEAVVQTNPMEN